MIRSPALAALVAVFLAAWILAGCTQATDTPDAKAPTHFSVISVSGPSAGRSMGARAFDAGLPVAYGHIDSGPPEYLSFTLKKITLSLATGGAAEIWSSDAGVPIRVVGNGSVDLSGVTDIAFVPDASAAVTDIKLTLATSAMIKGSLSAHFAGASSAQTLYTKAALSYNAHTYLGGSAATADFTAAPAEETEVWFNGPDNGGAADHEFTFPVSENLVAGETPKLSILFDISRALRFYDGQGGANQGPSPSDKSDSAYFFSHSVLANSIVCYFGDAGSIQGYSTLYQNSNAQAQNLVPGWMTLIFEANGSIQAGILIGDDDNAGTILKGLVTSASANATAGIDFHYDTSNVTVTGFTEASVLGASVDVAWAQEPDTGEGGGSGGGDARYALELKL